MIAYLNRLVGIFVIIVNSGGMLRADVGEFSLIPGGSFEMGDSFSEAFGNELPVHSVTLDDFYIGKTEVTYDNWQTVYIWALENGYNFDNPGLGKAANHPVHTISWYDVVKWCNAASERDGMPPVYRTVNDEIYRVGQLTPVIDYNNNGYRLPTEAEWEKAARGGGAGKRFPWGDTISHDEANYLGWGNRFTYDLGPVGDVPSYHPSYNDGIEPYTSPVGSFAGNFYGLSDMTGNVWEWCNDWHGYYSISPDTNPVGHSTGTDRVLRGASWKAYANHSRVSRRNFRGPNYTDIRGKDVGFRLARSSTPTNPAIDLQLYKITDTAGTRHTASPGNQLTTFTPGETVRITMLGANSGDSVPVQTILNLRGPDDSSIVYDSNAEGQNSTADSPLEDGETDYYSFDWTIPLGATLGKYDVLGSIRNQSDFDTVYDTTEPGPNTGFSGDYVIDDAFEVYAYPAGNYDIDIDEFSNTFGSLELSPFQWNSRGLWDWVVDLSWSAPAGCRIEVWATAYNTSHTSDPVLWRTINDDGIGSDRWSARPIIPGDANSFAISVNAFVYASDDPRNIPLASDSAIVTIPLNLPAYLPAASRPSEPAPGLVIRDIKLIEEGGFPSDPQELAALYEWYLDNYKQERADLLEMVDEAQAEAVYGALDAVIPLWDAVNNVFFGRYDFSDPDLIRSVLLDVSVELFQEGTGVPFFSALAYAVESVVSVDAVYTKSQNLQFYGHVLAHLQTQFTAPFVTASDGGCSDKIVLHWTPVTGASTTKFHSIYRGTDSDLSNAVPIFSVSGQSFEDTDVVVGQVYFYWIKTFLEDGTSFVFSPEPDSGFAAEPLSFVRYDAAGPFSGAGASLAFLTNDTVPPASVPSVITAGADTRYLSTGFVGTGNAPSGTTNSHDEFVITQDSGLTWLWQTEHLLQLSAGTGGSLISPASSWHGAGSFAVFEAEAATGYRFDSWSDPSASDPSAAETSVAMNSGKVISASFIKTWELTVTSSSNSQGSVSESGTHDDGADATITASPEPGWRFGSWSGGGVTDPNLFETTVTMTQGRTVTASFLINSTDGYNTWSTVFGGETNINRIGPNKDFDGDLKTNFYEYVFVLDPTSPTNGSHLVISTLQREGGRHGQLTFKTRSDDGEISYRVSVSGDLKNWTPVTLTYGGGAWSSTNQAALTVEAQTDHGDGTWSVTVEDKTPITGGSPRFIKVSADSPYGN